MNLKTYLYSLLSLFDSTILLTNLLGFLLLTFPFRLTLNRSIFSAAQGYPPQSSAESIHHRSSTNSEVLDGPIIIRPLTNVTASDQGVASFFCEVIAHPRPVFTWTVRGKNLTGKRFQVLEMEKGRLGSVLRIEPLSAEKDKNSSVKCEVFNEYGTVSSQANLAVLQAKTLPPGFPAIIQGPKRKVVEYGTSFSIPCNTIGQPSPRVDWLKNYAPIIFLTDHAEATSSQMDQSGNSEGVWRRHKLLNNGWLLVENAEYSDEGEYQCMATNKHGSAYSPTIAKIWVKERRIPPYFSILPPLTVQIAKAVSGATYPGSTKTRTNDYRKNITCVAVGSPMPLVRWKKISPVSTKQRPYNKQNNLGFPKLFHNHVNELRNDDIDDMIEDEMNDEFDQDRAEDGGDREMYQEFYRDFNQADTTSIDSFGNGYMGKVTIGKNVLQIGPLETGANFTCIAVSKLGTIQAITRILVRDLPGAPTFLNLLNVTSSSIMISWDEVTEPKLSDAPHLSYEIRVTTISNRDNPSVLEREEIVMTKMSEKPFTLLKYLKPSTPYHISVRATSIIGPGDWSEPLAITTLEDVPSSPPKNIRVRALSDTEFSVKWEKPDNSNGLIKAYILYYTNITNLESISQLQLASDSDDPKNFENIRRVFSHTNDHLPLSRWKELVLPNQDQSKMMVFTVKNLEPLTLYTVRMRVANSLGRSAPSDPVSVFTSPEIPGQITNFAGKVLNRTSVILSWSQSYDFELFTSYLLYVWKAEASKNGHGDNDSMRIVIDNPGVLNYTLINLVTGTLYQARIALISGQYMGVPSNTITLITPSTENKDDDDVDFANIGEMPTRYENNFLKLSGLPLNGVSLRVVAVIDGRFWAHFNEEEDVKTIKGFIIHSMTAPSNATDIIYGSESPKNIFVSLSEANTPDPEAKGEPRNDFHVSSKTLSREITGLRPFTLYKIWMDVRDTKYPLGNARYSSAPIFVKTAEDVPGEPRNVTLLALNSSSVSVHWQPPHENERNGEIMGYLVHYRQVLAKGKHIGPFKQLTIPDGNVGNIDLADLKADSFYKVQLSAFTRKGDGYRSKAKIVKTMGGVPTSPNLSLRLLEEYPELIVQAEWTRPLITYGPLLGYKLSFKPVYPESSYSTNTGRELGNENDLSGSKSVDLEGGDIYYYNFEHLERGKNYLFKLSAKNSRGYGEEILKYFETPEGIPTKAPVNLTYEFKTPTTINFGWSLDPDPTSWNGQITLHELSYYDLATQSDTISRNSTNPRSVVKGLKIGSSYSFRIRCFTAKGASPWSPALTIHLSSKEASPPVRNVKGYAISNTSASIYWDPPVLDNITSLSSTDITPVIKYQIFYTSKADQDYDYWDSTIFSIDSEYLNLNTGYLFNIGKRLNGDLIDLESGTVYAIQISALTDNGLGQLSEPIATVKTEPVNIPDELSLTNVGSFEMIVNWKSPAIFRDMAALNSEGQLEYEITYKGFKHFTNENSTMVTLIVPPKAFISRDSQDIYNFNSAKITDLEPFTHYVVAVRMVAGNKKDNVLANVNEERDKEDLSNEDWREIDKPAAKISAITDTTAPEAFSSAPYPLPTQTLKSDSYFHPKWDGIIGLHLPRTSSRYGLLSHYLLIVLPQAHEKAEKITGHSIVRRHLHVTDHNESDNNIYTLDELSYSPHYSDTNSPYIAALIPVANTGLMNHFPLGDGKFYFTFLNRPLSPGSTYKVFVRAFTGHFNAEDLIKEGNNSRTFHSKYQKFTSSPLSALFGGGPSSLAEDDQDKLVPGQNLATDTNDNFIMGKRSNHNTKQPFETYNDFSGKITSPKPAISLMVIISFSVLFAASVIGLAGYLFCAYGRRKRKNSVTKILKVNGGGKCERYALNTKVAILDHDREDGTLGSRDNFMNHIGSEYQNLLTREEINNDRETTTVIANKVAHLNSHPPIRLSQLAKYFSELKADDNALLNMEYQAIDPGQLFTWEHSNLPINKLKNRYANVVAYDHTRVVLRANRDSFRQQREFYVSGKSNDYINANYIDGYDKPTAYIATQGPLPETVTDFWRMVWQQNSCTIVMLTKLEERTRIKCDKYWPDKGILDIYGNGKDKDINETLENYRLLMGKGSPEEEELLQNCVVDCVELATYTIRTFCLQNLVTKEKREIKQFQYTAWPDHGVPSDPTPFLNFVKRVRVSNLAQTSPVIVHCSAGVGRTGTYITVDSMLDKLLSSSSSREDHPTIDIYGHVNLMRCQRNFMVQTADQYAFIYACVLEAYESGNTDFLAIDLHSHIQRLNHGSSTSENNGTLSMTGFEREFKKLSNQRPTTGKFVSANYPINKHKNRLVNILPYEHNRVCLCPVRGGQPGTDYINASFVDGYKEKNAYITTQGPLKETTDDFWRMIWEHNSSIIVMLTRLKENGREKCNLYWPVDGPSIHGPYTVEPVAEYAMPGYCLREFKMSVISQHAINQPLSEGNQPKISSILPPFPSATTRTIRQFHFEQHDPRANDGEDTMAEIKYSTLPRGDLLEQDENTSHYNFACLSPKLVGAEPPMEECFVDFVGQVHKTKDQFGLDGPITVHCSGGAGMTGVFLAVSIAVHRMKYESKVDIYQTVKWLRAQRPCMVQTLNQYKFCYRAALQYLRSFDMYAP
ncbi:receptor-type tyrosine-protein phosphatase F-like isoform X2 [Gordionus sp. m RMFG-2023]|uniref:receptor-type tyrosine-protein phosphatase F-like isoform X2 n=1 Tax=Gordionus sp. m RMFG-2023 TaxID=3053472 RepID=UPI0031FDF3C1